MIAIEDITLDDLKEEQLEVVEIIGLESYKKLIQYYAGTTIYIPKLSDIERRLRNEKIRDEYKENGDFKMLALKYSLTENQIRNIVIDMYRAKKDCPVEGQISIFEL